MRQQKQSSFDNVLKTESLYFSNTRLQVIIVYCCISEQNFVSSYFVQ